jgi:H+/gluconate symporter-like permease
MSLLGILLGLVVFIYLVYKNYSVIVVAPVAAAIVILLSGQDVLGVITSAFMPKFAGVVKSYFLLFSLSALLGKFASDTGLARSIAVTFANFAKKSKNNNKFLAIMSIVTLNAVLTYSGISLFVLTFTIVAIAKELYKELNVPWHLYGCGLLGSATITLSMIPGSPQVQNLIPIKYLGTTPMAAPVLGLISAAIMLMLGMAYIKYAIRQTEKEGEGFFPTGTLIDQVNLGKTEGEIHPMWKCLIPLLTPVVVMNGFKKAPEIALTCAVLVLFVLFRKEFANIQKSINDGFSSSIAPLVALAAAAAFGGVVASVPGFQVISTGLFNLPVPDTAKMLISVIVPTLIMGSSTGGLTVAFDSFADKYLAMGIHPEVIHRLTTMASNLSLTPHCSGVINTFVITKLDHKSAYKHYGIIGILLGGITVIIAAILATFGVM